MDINLLKRLIRIVEKSEITEFSIEEGDLKVKISKAGNMQPLSAVQPQIVQQAVPSTTPIATASPSIETHSINEPESNKEEASNLYEIKSPIVGTFYRAPAPDADTYVQVGDPISLGTVRSEEHTSELQSH